MNTQQSISVSLNFAAGMMNLILFENDFNHFLGIFSLSVAVFLFCKYLRS